MNFRIQEVIKMLVPGTLLIICLYLLFFNFTNIDLVLNKEYVALYILLFLVIIYIIGYFVDWFGSIFERLYYRVFARPSFILLNNTGKHPIHGIKMLKFAEIGDELCKKTKASSQFPYTKENAERLFKVANYLKDRNTNAVVKERLNDFYYYSIFSRNLALAFLTTFLFYPIVYLLHNWGIFQIINQPNDWSGFNWNCAILLLPFLLCILRWREHALYYSRYVFYAASEDILKL